MKLIFGEIMMMNCDCEMHQDELLQETWTLMEGCRVCKTDEVMHNHQPLPIGNPHCVIHMVANRDKRF